MTQTTTPGHDRPAAATPPAFASVLCGIGGGRADAEAARQAAVLAGPAGRVDLVTVIGDLGPNASEASKAQVVLDRRNAERALARASGIAAGAGAQPDTRIIGAVEINRALLDEAAIHDLLVVGTCGGTRFGDLVLNRPEGAALRKAACPVLVARPGPQDARFPGRILLADDGTGSAAEAVRLAGAIAAAHGSPVTVASPARAGAETRRALDGHLRALRLATGQDPTTCEFHGTPSRAIVELARELEASLVVVGSRGLRGLRALAGSVSERVAHLADCSVLVAHRPAA